jgi:ADP-heptose:LPS heptosyltransferase
MINNIFVVCNDKLGEFLLIIPALRALKERFPGVNITIAVDLYAAELAEAIEYVNDVIIWEKRKHPLKELFKFSSRIRGRGFDLAVIFNPTFEAHWAVFLAKIPVRVGYKRENGFLLTHRMKDLRYLTRMHGVEYNLELVGLIGAVTKDKSIALKIEDFDLLGAIKDSNIVAIHPWAKDPANQWSLSNFKELIKRLGGLNIVLIGGKEELIKNKEFFTGLDELVINFTGKTNLVQLAAILKKVNLLVTGDSGLMHMSAAVGTPVIALFGDVFEDRVVRHLKPWGEGHIVIEKAKLSDISVDEVVEKVREVYSRK